MDPTVPANDEQDLDTRLLSKFIYEVNIARRFVTAYPGNHPIIGASAEKVLTLLRQLLEFRRQLTLGIARDTLMVGGGFLDKSNPVYRDFARTLFSCGIAALTIDINLTKEELLNFFHLLTIKRENTNEQGGIENAFHAAGILHLRVTAIDYGAFRATETDDFSSRDEGQPQPTSQLWEDFIQGLLEGNISLEFNSAEIDPAVLAAMLNKEYSQSSKALTKESSYDHSITAFLRQLDKEDLNNKHRQESIRKLSAFVNRLEPELRRQLLNSAFKTLATRQELAESVISSLSDEVILDALDDINRRQAAIPSFIMSLIGKMASNIFSGNEVTPFADSEGITEKNELHEKLRVLFQEESLDKFIPDAYQETLRTIISSKRISAPEQQEIEFLKGTLTSHHVESQVSRIILEIINQTPTDCETEVLEKNLLDLSGYFLGMGDFAALSMIYERLNTSEAAQQPHLQEKILQIFARTDFVEEALTSLHNWGKAKYPEIRELIATVGTPFIEPILERLAEEQNMSLRRFYMECLHDLGTLIKDAAVAKLRDKRWYFVRNLIIILREMNDPNVLQPIRRLSNHPHPKVRTEVLKTLLYFSDPEGERQLLQDMASSNDEVLLQAVRLAEHCRSRLVVNRIVEFLSKSGMSGFDLELKLTAVRTLGIIGDSIALPEMERLLKSRSMLRHAALNRLKSEIVLSLRSYPIQEVIDLVKRLAANGHAEDARLAQEIYQSLRGKEQ